MAINPTFLNGTVFTLTSESGFKPTNNLDIKYCLGRVNWLPNNLGTVEPRKNFPSIDDIHPLDLVKLQIENNETTDIVPAIYAFYHGTSNNRDYLLNAVGNCTNILGLSSSLRVLFTKGAPKILKIIAAVEIGKTAIDAIMQDPAIVAKIKTGGGTWFVENWNWISISIDLTVFSADVLNNIITSGKKAKLILNQEGKNDAANAVDNIVEEAEDAALINSLGNWQRILNKIDNFDLENLKIKLNTFDELAKARFTDDIANLSDNALKQLDDNFGLLDEWKQIDALSVSAQASKKPIWLQKILDGNEFNRIRSSSYPNNEVYLVNPNNPSKYVRLDSYKPGQEIVSRKYTQFSEIQESTGIKYIQELKDKYSPGTIIANVPSNKIGGTNSTLQSQVDIRGKMYLEIPVQSAPIPQSVIDRANNLNIDIRDVQGKIYN